MQKDNQLMLGFSNFKELMISAFGLNQPLPAIIGGTIAALSTFITNYIYDDARAIYTLIAIILLDAITGITRAVKQNKFSSSRLPRILVIMILYTGLMAIGWNLSKISVVYSWLPGILYGGFVSTLIISIFENAHQIGLIPDNIYYYFKNKIALMQSFLFGSSFNSLPKEPEVLNPIGLYKANIFGELIYADNKLCEIVGYSKEEIINTSKLLSRVHPDDSQTVIKSWENAVKTRASFYIKYRFIKEDGSIITILSQSSPMKDSNNQIIGWLGTLEKL